MVCHRDIANEMADRRSGVGTVVPERDLPEIGKFRGVASCNSFSPPEDNVDSYTSRTMATILLRPGNANEPPLFPVGGDGAITNRANDKSFGTWPFMFTAEIPCELLDHDDAALVSFGVASENFKCNYYPGVNHRDASFPKETDAAVAGAFIRRHIRDGEKEWAISAGVSLGDTNPFDPHSGWQETIRMSKEKWESEVFRTMQHQGNGSATEASSDTITVGCGLAHGRFFVVLPGGAYTFPQKWSDEQAGLAPGLFDLNNPKTFKLFGPKRTPSQLMLSVRCSPNATDALRKMTIRLSVRRVHLSRLESLPTKCDGVSDPWTESFSPIVDLSLAHAQFRGIVPSQAVFSSCKIVLTGQHTTPSVVCKEEGMDRGHIIHMSTGCYQNIDTYSPLNSWSTSLRGLSLPDDIVGDHQRRDDSEAGMSGGAQANSTTSRITYPSIECVYTDKDAAAVLPTMGTFIVPTCVISANQDAQYCQFDIDLSGNQWSPGLLAFGLISLDDYFSLKPRDTSQKPRQWTTERLLQQLCNRDAFPIKLLNPGNSREHTSMGFHSDDGSFVTNCFTVTNKDSGSIHKIEGLKWWEFGNPVVQETTGADTRQYSLGVGFDGFSVFIVHPNGKKIRFESFMATDSWKNGSAFVPILMVADCNQKCLVDEIDPLDVDPLSVVMSLSITASMDGKLKRILQESTAVTASAPAEQKSSKVKK